MCDARALYKKYYIGHAERESDCCLGARETIPCHFPPIYHICTTCYSTRTLGLCEWIIAPLNKYIMTFTGIARHCLFFNFATQPPHVCEREVPMAYIKLSIGTRVRYTAIAKTIKSPVRIGSAWGINFDLNHIKTPSKILHLSLGKSEQI